MVETGTSTVARNITSESRIESQRRVESDVFPTLQERSMRGTFDPVLLKYMVIQVV
jgi:hypothetical protein